MFNLLIDTCVWIELAKDHQQQPILAALEQLIQRKQVSLILPHHCEAFPCGTGADAAIAAGQSRQLRRIEPDLLADILASRAMMPGLWRSSFRFDARVNLI